MSTIQPRDPTDVARDLTDLYDVAILSNPEVCGTCHARIRDRAELDTTESHDGLGTGNRPDAVLTRVHAGAIGHDVEDKDSYGAQKAYRTRTVCADCGRFGGGSGDDPPPRRTMLNRVDPLVDRLADQGVDCDVDTVRATVRHCKSQPEYDGRTDDIWRAATALGVRDAYG